MLSAAVFSIVQSYVQKKGKHANAVSMSRKIKPSLLAPCNSAKGPSNASCYAMDDAAVFAVKHQ